MLHNPWALLVFQQCLLDSRGAYTEEAGNELAGKFVADADTENTGIYCKSPNV